MAKTNPGRSKSWIYRCCLPKIPPCNFKLPGAEVVASNCKPCYYQVGVLLYQPGRGCIDEGRMGCLSAACYISRCRLQANIDQPVCSEKQLVLVLELYSRSQMKRHSLNCIWILFQNKAGKLKTLLHLSALCCRSCSKLCCVCQDFIFGKKLSYWQ